MVYIASAGWFKRPHWSVQPSIPMRICYPDAFGGRYFGKRYQSSGNQTRLCDILSIEYLNALLNVPFLQILCYYLQRKRERSSALISIFFFTSSLFSEHALMLFLCLYASIYFTIYYLQIKDNSKLHYLSTSSIFRYEVPMLFFMFIFSGIFHVQLLTNYC